MLTSTAARLMLQEIRKEHPEEIDRLIDLIQHEELDKVYFSFSNGDLKADIKNCLDFWIRKFDSDIGPRLLAKIPLRKKS